jgi:DNA-binding HxlR family transcriptional regulator
MSASITMKKMPPDNCAVALSAELFADTWTVLILRGLFAGETQFDELLCSTGAASSILAVRLKKMHATGLLDRSDDCADGRKKHYGLTKKGRATAPLLLSLMQYGETWLVDKNQAMTQLLHTACGQYTRPNTACSHCGEGLKPSTVRVVMAQVL